MADTPSSSWRRRLLWLGAGLFLGFVGALGILALPAVQGWLVRYALRSQTGANVEFRQMRVGPTGGSAQELRLHLPNFAIEARALRLALSPWQLLTRRRLAVDSVEARELQLTARSTGEASAPFDGVLDQLQAPLDWAVTQADAEGRFILEQTGAEPLIATFKIRGANLHADQPGELDVEFSAPGDLLPGWKGRWDFHGQLAYTPDAKGQLDAVALRGTLTAATHADYQSVPLRIAAIITRTPTGESYVVTLENPVASLPALTGRIEAAFTRASYGVAGTWSFSSGEQLAAHFLKRPNLPSAALTGRGTLAAHTRSGEIAADGSVELRAKGWEKLAPELAQLGAAQGTNTFSLTRRDGRWQMDSFDAALAVDGSDARVRFRSLQAQPLVPFRAGDIEWAELTVAGIPLEWARPFLPGITLTGGAISGAWRASTPSDAELHLSPTRPVETGRFTIAHPALPAVQPMEFSLSPVVRLTPDAAQLELRQVRFAFERGDYLELDATSTVDFTHLTAQLSLSWTAKVPSLLAGPDQPIPFTLSGKFDATASEKDLSVAAATFEARSAGEAEPVLRADLLHPVRYHFSGGQLDAPEDIARIRAQALPLAWLGRFQPDLALAGAIAGGESILGFSSGSVTLRTTTPWTLTGLSVAQKTGTLLRDAALSLSPAGSVAWPIAGPIQATATLQVRATVPEAAEVVDAAGPFQVEAGISVAHSAAGVTLDAATLMLTRGNGESLVDLRTERAMTFKDDAPVTDDLPVWFKLRTGRVPLEMFRAQLGPEKTVEGELEPAEFVARADWPTLNIRANSPVVANIRRYVSAGVPWLENVKLSGEPGIQNSKLLHAAFVENLKGLPPNAELGSLGSGFVMFLGDNFAMPAALVFKTQIDLAQWQQQPIAEALSLPVAGLITTGYEHDLFNDKQPTLSFVLEKVPGAEGQPPLAPLQAEVKFNSLAAVAKDEIAARIEVELGTQPRMSSVAFDATLNNRDKLVNVNSTLKGEFVDIAELERLIAATERKKRGQANDSAAAPAKIADTPAASASPRTLGQSLAEQTTLEFPFWLVIRGRFELELNELARAPYRIDDVRGTLDLTDDTLAIRNLSGRTFDGAWSGGMKVDFRPKEPEAPYQLAGNFRVDRLDAAAIVASVYPDETPLFTGRLSLQTGVRSRGRHLAGLLQNSSATFGFHADDGRLSVKVPHANLASTALVFGGAITLSPELRALGRLITKFDGMPVQTLRASGRREPNGLVALDELRVETPQLRLTATGRWQLQENTPWPATPFELPVSIAAKDEMAVIFKGMRLLEKKPGADGFFALTRTSKLKGTPGQPDTSELFDMLAHAADKSSGTFGFLMRKLQKEVAKTQAAKPSAK
ncbi:MAG: hypothetical protein C0518_08665 [Opitutus sp.]|nr:hypothetical protein [Opitutus sp.]